MIKSALSRLGSGAIVYGVGTSIQRFLGLLLLPLFTRALSPEEYGVAALITVFGTAVNGLLTLGTGNSMGLLYYKEKDVHERHAVISTNICLMLGNGLLWYLVIWQTAPLVSVVLFQSVVYADLIRVALLSSVIAIVADPWLAYLRMEGRARDYVLLTVITAILGTLASLTLVLILDLGLLGLLLAGVFTSTLMFLLTWIFVGRKVKFTLRVDLLVPLVRIGFPSIFGLFAFLMIDYADRAMIERMAGLASLGIYSVGYSFGMVVMVAMNAFSIAWPPFFMSYVTKQDEVKELFGQVLTYYVIVFGGLVVLFFLAAKPIIVLMTADDFHDAWVVVGMVAAGYAMKGCYLIMLPGIYYAEKLGTQSVIEWTAAIVNLCLNLWLIPEFGIFGAAVATFLSYLSLPVLAWSVSRRYLEVQYQWKRICHIGLVVMLFSFVGFRLNDSFVEFSLTNMLVICAIGAVYLVTTFSFFLNTRESDFLKGKLKF